MNRSLLQRFCVFFVSLAGAAPAAVLQDQEPEEDPARFEERLAAYQARVEALPIDHRQLMEKCAESLRGIDGAERWLPGAQGWFPRRPAQAFLEWNGPAPEGEGVLALSPDASEHPFRFVRGFSRQLADRGVQMLFAPVPSRLHLYPEEYLGVEAVEDFEGHAPGTLAFLEWLQESGVGVVDLFTPLAQHRAYDEERDPLFLEGDPHWSPRGAQLAAEVVARAMLALPGVEPGPLRKDQDLFLRPARHVYDAPARLRPPEYEGTQTLRFTRVLDELGRQFEPEDAQSSVVLIGDSFVSQHQRFGADFATYFAAEMGRTIDVVARPGNGAFGVRNSLSLRNDGMAGKAAVVWLVSVQTLRCFEDWKPVRLR